MTLLIRVCVLLQAVLPAFCRCATDGSDYEYTEAVSGDTRTVKFNVCPNHYSDSGTLNPNYAVAGSKTYKMPAMPMYESSSTDDVSNQGGDVGVLFDGAFIYSAFAGKVALTNYASSAPALEGNTFDKCGEHSASTSSAAYHAHTPPVCLLHQLGSTSTSAHSPQVGWAPDGFPVYGPRGPTGSKLKLCSESTNTDTTNCLDECSGLAKELPAIDQFTYRYYITGEDHLDGSYASNPHAASNSALTPQVTSPYFPFTPMCYKGCCPSGVTCSGSKASIPSCSNSAMAGTTSSYTAAAKYASGLPVYTGSVMDGAAATDAPATDAPATDAPATDAPATDAPATDAPATDAPATDAPATGSTAAPAADAGQTSGTSPTSAPTSAPSPSGSTAAPAPSDTSAATGRETTVTLALICSVTASVL